VEEMQKLFDELKSYIDQKFADFAKQDAEQDKETAEEVEGQEEAVEEKEAESENVEAAEEEKVESPAEEPAEDVKDEEKEEVKAESEEEVKDEEDKKEGLSAGADLLSVIESLRSEVASLKAEKEERAKHEKKSVSYPMTLMAKHDIQPQDDYKSVIASIDAREGLSVEDRIALKLEAKAQFGNK
jgi:colicin import membrane protein